MTEFLIGRQQIFDRNLNLFGYELLFRSVHGNPADAGNGTSLTNQLIFDTLLEFGLEKITGKARAFINMTAENILQGTATLLPKKKVVIEILENTLITPELVKTLRRLVHSGYLLALDDFVFEADWEALVKMAHIIKIDVRAGSEAETTTLLKRLKNYPAKILLEKIETEEEFKHYLDLGGDYYQGFFLHHPQIVSGRRMEAHQQTLLRLLAQIYQPNVELNQVANIIRKDTALSYKLLKFINSSLFNLPRKIDSIEQAVVLLGLRELQRWAALLSLGQNAQSRPGEYLRTALLRARMCELLAQSAKLQNPGEYFLVGMLSTLDLLLAMPLAEILNTLPLAKEIRQGLLEHQGPLGEALSCTLHYESWQLQQVRFASLSLETISRIYLESVAWTQQSFEQLAG